MTADFNVWPRPLNVAAFPCAGEDAATVPARRGDIAVRTTSTSGLAW